VAFAILVALAVVAASGAPEASAASKKTCGEQVVEDWYRNHGVVRKIYPIHCYRDAINDLETDLRIYSGAEEDIRRAMLYAQRNQPDPGPEGGSGTKSEPGTSPESGSGPGSGPGSELNVNTAGPSAVPIPVIVLAGVAGLLLVLGAAGYLTRRTAARRAGNDGASDT
jgi:hypothetical protein